MGFLRQALSRKFLVGFFLVGGISLTSGCTPPPPRHPENICAIFTERRAWYRAAAQAADKWQVPVPVTMAIMFQESGFRGQVGTKRNRLFGFIPTTHVTSAYGYAQALDGVWAEYLKKSGTTKRKRQSFRDSLDFMNWYIDRSARKLSIGKADAYRQYLAYHEGIAGYRRKSFDEKPEIKKTALLVQERAAQYQAQYEICAPQLKQRSFIRWIFEALLDHITG